MILVAIQNAGDIPLAKALVCAIGAHTEVCLVFAGERLLRSYGSATCFHTTDWAGCMLHAATFDLLVTFAGASGVSGDDVLALLTCFNDLGVATVDIQRGLFEFGTADVARKWRKGDEEAPWGAIGGTGSTSTSIRWDGQAGVGYLKSIIPQERLAISPGFVLIATGTHSAVYSDKDRFVFAIALCRLVQENADTTFVWCPDPAERGVPGAKQVQEMLEGYGFSNLRIERDHGAHTLAPLCRVAVTTLSTAMLDLQNAEKPALVFTPAHLASLLSNVQAQTFVNATDLLERWCELKTQESSFRISTGIPPLNRQKLLVCLDAARATTKVRENWQTIAAKAALAYNEARVHAAVLMELQNAVSELRRSVEETAISEAGLARRLSTIERAALGAVARLKHEEVRLQRIEDLIRKGARRTEEGVAKRTDWILRELRKLAGTPEPAPNRPKGAPKKSAAPSKRRPQSTRPPSRDATPIAAMPEESESTVEPPTAGSAPSSGVPTAADPGNASQRAGSLLALGRGLLRAGAAVGKGSGLKRS